VNNSSKEFLDNVSLGDWRNMFSKICGAQPSVPSIDFTSIVSMCDAYIVLSNIICSYVFGLKEKLSCRLWSSFASITLLWLLVAKGIHAFAELPRETMTPFKSHFKQMIGACRI